MPQQQIWSPETHSEGRLVKNVPASGVAHLRTEQAQRTEDLLTQTEGEWRDEWRSGERMWAMWREGETDNGYRPGGGTGQRRYVYPGQQGSLQVGTHTQSKSLDEAPGVARQEGGDRFSNPNPTINLQYPMLKSAGHSENGLIISVSASSKCLLSIRQNSSFIKSSSVGTELIRQ